MSFRIQRPDSNLLHNYISFLEYRYAENAQNVTSSFVLMNSGEVELAYSHTPLGQEIENKITKGLLPVLDIE
jgi:hypothetical protein